MEWYEIVIVIPLLIIGAFIRGKIYENKKNTLKMVVGKIEKYSKRLENVSKLIRFVHSLKNKA